MSRKEFRDVPLRLSGSESLPLLHGNLKSGTVRVKGLKKGTPNYESITLVDQRVAPLKCSNVVPDSVVVASNSSLGTIYTEEVDYHVAPQRGALYRIATGKIPDGKELAVWYYPYRLYVEGVDFSVDYKKGVVRRIPSGAIEDGQTVYVDYVALEQVSKPVGEKWVGSETPMQLCQSPIRETDVCTSEPIHELVASFCSASVAREAVRRYNSHESLVNACEVAEERLTRLLVDDRLCTTTKRFITADRDMVLVALKSAEGTIQ